jgi:hypothetical protein
MLPDKVIAIYCFCDDLLKALDHPTKAGCRTTDAEIITTALVSALFFRGNQSLSIHYMRAHNLAPGLPHKSGFTKRLHAVSELLLTVFQQVGHLVKHLHCGHRYLLDSFPVAACHLARLKHCRLLQGKQYLGYCAAQHQYFYGVRIQLITTQEGVPVEVCFVAGAEHDARALDRLLWDFAPGDQIYNDNAYTSYLFEDLAAEAGLDVRTARKPSAKRKDAPWMAYLKVCYRKQIESTISAITGLMPRALHCVSTQGFFIKVLLFIMAYQFDKVV